MRIFAAGFSQSDRVELATVERAFWHFTPNRCVDMRELDRRRDALQTGRLTATSPEAWGKPT